MVSNTEFTGNLSKIITFAWYDYLLFSIVLGGSCLIGIYYGFFDKQNTKNDYLLGGKKMKVWPIAISLVASHTSGITLLALPADIYKYGIGFIFCSLALYFLHLITSNIFLPVFYKLEITSTYEYLALRYDEKTRMMASALYAISLLLYLPIVIYVPSLGFATATGVGIHKIAAITSGICIFYTTIGGLKAVVWTDVFQFTLTVGCLITVLWLALKQAGGFLEMWNIALEGHRLDVDFDPDPTKRDGFWTVVIGLTVLFVAQNSCNQGCIQKLLALPTMKDAVKSNFLFSLGSIVTKSMSVVIGLTMYAVYAGCDPFTTKQVSRNDELVSHFIMDVGSAIPGISGLFFAGIFSSALSTLSASLNCVAGTLYTDFFLKLIGSEITEKMASNILKLFVMTVGIASWLMVYVVENLGGIIQLEVSLRGIADGPLLGIFTMGILSRKFTSKAAFYGAILSMLFMSWMFIMQKYNNYIYEGKPFSTENCTFNFHLNQTTTPIPSKESNDTLFFLFRLSFYYYTLMGTLTTILFGTIIDLFTRKSNEPLVPKKLLSPIILWLYRNEDDTENLPKKQDYYKVQQFIHDEK